MPQGHRCFIAREHPGKTAAEWFAEGKIEWLVNGSDKLANAILQKAMVRVVRRLNRYGSVLGDLPTNARLHRSESHLARVPTKRPAPMCLRFRHALFDLGVDNFLDVHADERHPYVFAVGGEGKRR